MGDLSKDLFSGATPYVEREWDQGEQIPLEGIELPPLDEPACYADPAIEPYPRLVRAVILCGAAAGSWAIVIGLVILIRR